MGITTDTNTKVTIELDENELWLWCEGIILYHVYIKDTGEVTKTSVKVGRIRIPRSWLSDEQIEIFKKAI